MTYISDRTLWVTEQKSKPSQKNKTNKELKHEFDVMMGFGNGIASLGPLSDAIKNFRRNKKE